MALMTEPWCFTAYQDNMGNPLASVAQGTNVIAGANNTPGSDVTLIASTNADTHYLVISASGFSLSPNHCPCLANIKVTPPGGSEYTIVPNLQVGPAYLRFSASNGWYVDYRFPIFIPAGSEIKANAQTAHTVNITTGNILLQLYGNPSRSGVWWYGSGVEPVGVNAASSIGTSITHSGSFYSWGAWTNLGSPTEKRFGAFGISLPTFSGYNSTPISMWMQLGVNSTPLQGVPPFPGHAGSYNPDYVFKHIPLWCDIPAGTQLQARQMSRTTGGESVDVGIYGVY